MHHARWLLAATLSASLSLFASSALPQQATLSLSDWKATVPISGARTSHAAFAVGNRLYVLGGLRVSEGAVVLLDDVQVAEIGNDGSVLQAGWRELGHIPGARSGHGVVALKERVYLVGGYSAAGTLDDTEVATLQADGSIGPWMKSDHHLNIPKSNLGLETWKASSGRTYLLAIGGVDQVGSDTVHFDQVEAALIADDGSVGQWRVCPFHLKGGRSAPATVVAAGKLLVLGGWGDLLDDVFGDIQTSTLQDDGCPGPWTTAPRPLTLPVYGHSAVAVSAPAGSTIFVFGGNAGQGNYLNTTQFVALSGDGMPERVGFDSHLFTTARWGHVTVRYNDFVYVIGGARREGDGYLADVQFTRASVP